MLTISWLTLGVIAGCLILTLGISSYMVNYLDCFKRTFSGIYQNFKFSYILKYIPEKSLMLALDYFISAHYGTNAKVEGGIIFQTIPMIVAAYLPDKNISAKELTEITLYILDRRFKVSKMFETEPLDIPLNDKQIVDKVVDLVKDIYNDKITPVVNTLEEGKTKVTTLENKPLSILKDILEKEIPEITYYQKTREQKASKGILRL